jgi:hypothetical protein
VARPAPKLPLDSIAHGAAAGRVRAGEAQQPPETERVGRDRGVCRDGARRRRDHRRGMRVAVPVDADDVIDLLCKPAHR